MPACPICKGEVNHGDHYSGLKTPHGYVEGHTVCVVRHIGPVEAKSAVADGRLPPLSPEGLPAGEATITPSGQPRFRMKA